MFNEFERFTRKYLLKKCLCTEFSSVVVTSMFSREKINLKQPRILVTFTNLTHYLLNRMEVKSNVFQNLSSLPFRKRIICSMEDWNCNIVSIQDCISCGMASAM